MYDPDRSQETVFRGTPTTWQNFMTAMRGEIERNSADGGAGVRFMTETVTSPTLIAQMRQIATELPNSRWIQYEPINNDSAMTGAKMAFGVPVQTIYKFDQADRVLTLDTDIFNDFNVRYMKDYAKARAFSAEKQDINRLYAVESTMTVTGAKADHRLAVKPSQVGEVAKALAAAVGISGAAPQGLSAEATQWVNTLARDLQGSRGRSIVVAGDSQSPTVHAIAHAINGALGNVGQTVVYTEPFSPFADRAQIDQLRELVADIDGGRVKMLVIMGGNPVYNTPVDLKINAERMNKIPLRVHLGQYVDETAELCHWHVSEKHFLESWGDARAYDGTATIVQPLIEPLYDSKSIYEVAQVFFRENYDKRDYDIVKEFWQTQNINAGGARAAAATGGSNGGNANGTGANIAGGSNNAGANNTGGTTGAGSEAVNNGGANGRVGNAGANFQTGEQSAPASTVQARQTQSPGQSLTNEAARNQNAPTPPAQTAPPAQGSAAAANFEDNWRRVVHNGFIPNSAAPLKTVSVNAGFLGQPEARPAAMGALEISIRKDPTVYDGRFANNGWLQELPKPLTKVTWDNVAFISPRTAERLGLNQGRDYNPYSARQRERALSIRKAETCFLIWFG
jgi:anaerobic selenocysteine-containing dehydrogenase